MHESCSSKTLVKREDRVLSEVTPLLNGRRLPSRFTRPLPTRNLLQASQIQRHYDTLPIGQAFFTGQALASADLGVQQNFGSV